MRHLLLQKYFHPLKRFQNIIKTTTRYKIIAQDFDEHSNETRFQIKGHSKKLITLTAKQFALDKKLLYRLTQEDAYLIGYIFASELVAREKNSMMELRAEFNAGVQAAK